MLLSIMRSEAVVWVTVIRNKTFPAAIKEAKLVNIATKINVHFILGILEMLLAES